MKREMEVPELNLDKFQQNKKFKRTSKVLNINTSRSKGSVSSGSSTGSFYIPQKKISESIPRISVVETHSSLELQSSRCTLLTDVDNFRLQTDTSLSGQKNQQFKKYSEKEIFLEEIESLKRHNEEYKKKIQALTETFDQHMKSCEVRNTNKMKSVIKLARLSQLEELNKKLHKQIEQLKEENQSLKQLTSERTSSTSLSFLEHETPRMRRVSEQYLVKTQTSNFQLKEENHELKLKIDYLNRKFYKDVQQVRQKKENEYKHLKQKYLEQVNKNKQISRENVELCVEIKKLQRQIISLKGNKFNKSKLTKKASVTLLQLSSQDD